MAYLLLVSGGEPRLPLQLHRGRTVLGREADCDIVIKDVMFRRDVADTRVASVSRRHAVISYEEGKYYIEDGDGQGRESRNHTFVNEQKLAFPGRVLLQNDDRIRICDFICTFYEEPDSSFSVVAAIDRDSSNDTLQAQPADKLRIILEISNSLSHTLDIDSLLPRIIDSLLELYKLADRGFIILRDEATGELVPRVSKTRAAGDDPTALFSHSIVRQCLENSQAILGDDLAHQFPNSDSISALPIRSLMCAPLWSQDGRPWGVIQLDSDGSKKKFSPDDLKLLLGVASQASIALSNARLHRDLLIHQARVRDLELAQQVQRALLPQRLPDISGYDFYAYYESAQEVGGDYYDFIPLPQQRLAVLLGDVAGKGVAAALVMVKFSVEVRARLLTEPELAAAVTQLNALMNQSSLSDRFVTLIAAVLDPASHTVTLVNAGHPSPLLFRRAGGAVEEVVPAAVAGPPVGIGVGHVYRCCQVPLQPGDGLILFSDGVTDAMNPLGRRFRANGVRTVLQGGHKSARETGERLIQTVKQHAAGCRQNDDITLVCFGRAAI